MDKIKFGTDGWWGIIAKDFTLKNVAKVAYGIARWMTSKFQVSSVVLGYDCRFGGEMFMEAIAKILASKNIQVYLPENYVSTPMVSLAVVKLKAECGVMVTAGHSPAMYNGIKLKGAHGGPLLETEVKNIENLIPSDYEFDLELLNWNYLLEQGKIQYINIESIYYKHLCDSFDMDRLASSKQKFAFDAMYGSTQRVIAKLLPGAKFFHCEQNPGFNNIIPEPTHKNLHELAEFMWKNKEVGGGLALNADGDRLAIYDENGNFVNPHKLILLLIHYLCKYDKQTGKIVVGFSTTGKVEKLASHYGQEVERVRLGFHNIAEVMLKDEILVGGEESGCMTIGSYMPEADGMWIGILIWTWLANNNLTLSGLLKEIEEITGTFSFDRIDLQLNKKIRTRVIENCKQGNISGFGSNKVTQIEELDGFKFYFGDNEWVLLRPSSIHPTLRIYAEAADPKRVRELLLAVQQDLINLN